MQGAVQAATQCFKGVLRSFAPRANSLREKKAVVGTDGWDMRRGRYTIQSQSKLGITPHCRQTRGSKRFGKRYVNLAWPSLRIGSNKNFNVLIKCRKKFHQT